MAKVIMIQGTMSNAGKSLLAAGLCRIFHQDGYRVAPFKSQNMALNSFITREGLEMGRAQVMQAEAAGIEPSVLMNPILLKPTNDTGSQVIVNGEVLGNMSAREYFSHKKELIPDIMKAYHALEEQYDIIVIEGAGSPAEINLKADDIVNMGMAKLVDAPVLLVGDIDRGGVFAQLYGTVELLEPDERDRIKGLIINKFRGDKTILDPGVVMLEEKTHIPVVGVAPYLHIEVEDEDSLTERFTRKEEIGLIDLAVIRLPRISNFTDFNPFERIEGVSLRYVSSVSELKNPDMILLPGTKNTMEDLLWMRQNGLEAAVLKAAAAGKVIFGVCGGFQMLGDTLSDPLHVEAGGTIKGMGLLPMDTVFAGEKTRTRAEGAFGKTEGVLAGIEGTRIEGYEIHMGETVRKEGTEAFTFIDDQNRADSDKLDGAQKGNVYGTYVHGIFDKEEVAERIVEAAERHGIPRPDAVIDCLTMACATNQSEALEILRAVAMVKERLGVRTALGVSNISFGLPQRNMVNSTFLAAAFGCGLDMPILNPKAKRYTDTVNTFRVLNCQDAGAVEFIGEYADAADPYTAGTVGAGAAVGAAEAAQPSGAADAAAECPVAVPEPLSDAADAVRDMVHLILTGRKGPMGPATEALLEGHNPLDLVNGVFVPALDVVGQKFDKGEFFLPQLMASAEAVKVGFDVVKAHMGDSADDGMGSNAIAVATVKGDIHDIGKNIVKMLLENYGFRVVDLGRDVEPEEVLRVASEQGIRLVGLSALMTTTVRAMEQTVELLHEKLPGCKVMVGGAVLTPEYAEQIGADYYAKDAAESARIAERFFAEQG